MSARIFKWTRTHDKTYLADLGRRRLVVVPPSSESPNDHFRWLVEVVTTGEVVFSGSAANLEAAQDAAERAEVKSLG
jgi:hypothetical protein